MFTVSENAKEELKRISGEVLEKPESKLRLVANPEGQLGLAADEEREGDQIVEHEGNSILLIGQELSTALDGLGIDYQDADEGPRLVLTRNDPQEPETQ